MTGGKLLSSGVLGKGSGYTSCSQNHDAITRSASNRRLSFLLSLKRKAAKKLHTYPINRASRGTKEPHPQPQATFAPFAWRAGRFKEENPFCPPVLSSCAGRPGPPGRRLEGKEVIRFCPREASPCRARRRKGTISAGRDKPAGHEGPEPSSTQPAQPSSVPSVPGRWQ